ncbi:hypothetical protein KAI46_09150 [bacterium]|nr:hypothetical protein [bacterium]
MALDLKKIGEELISIINDNIKGLTKNCARNALRHLEKSWEIKDINPEIRNRGQTPIFVHR